MESTHGSQTISLGYSLGLVQRHKLHMWCRNWLIPAATAYMIQFKLYAFQT